MGDERQFDRWWPYDSVSRRRGRSLGRAVDATLRARTTRQAILPAYWWDGHPNFGDALTPWILARYGIMAVNTPPSTARMVGVGSILEQLPESYDGAVWGSGLLHGEAMRLPHAQILAVRGPLTRDALGVTDDITLGDPGLLVARQAARRRVRWQVGVVPHGFHREDPVMRTFAARVGRDATVIDVRSRPGPVIRQIAACAAIVTTSLHGLVVADGLGIPAAWTQRHPALWGADFKFRDYEAVLTPGRSREFVLTETSRLSDVLGGVDLPDADARIDAIRKLEHTIPRLPVTHDVPWRALGLRSVGAADGGGGSGAHDR